MASSRRVGLAVRSVAENRADEENQLQRISFPARDHSPAIWLYLRFTLSLCDVDDLLAERGMAVSDETVRSSADHSDR